MAKILIVEDDPMISEIYQKKFADGGFEVVAAMSGKEAVSKAQSAMPDVILLDLVMPEMDGFEILKKIKKDKTLSATKVLVFSNLSQPEDKEKAKSLGADDFLSKTDYEPSELVKKVKKMVD